MMSAYLVPAIAALAASSPLKSIRSISQLNSLSTVSTRLMIAFPISELPSSGNHLLTFESATVNT